MAQDFGSPGPHPAGDGGAGEELAFGGRIGRPFVLTDTQFQQLLAVVERRQNVLSVPELTEEQKALADGFRKLGQSMGVGGFVVAPPPLVRSGRVLAVHPPTGTTKARLYLQSGNEVLDLRDDASQLWLPERITHKDRIARLEYVDAKGIVLGFTGGEVRDAHDTGYCD
jgi:hypothetical protein